jgi:uncharacterized protein
VPDALIVADTGPLISLSHVDALHVLPALYPEVLLPEAVAVELKASRFEIVHEILDENPWLQVRRAAKPVDPALHAALDDGEAEAIALALEVRSPLLIDELRGRRIAASIYGIDVRGTLGTLVRARNAQLIGPLSPLLERLVARGDHLGQELIREALRAVGELG